MGYRGYRHFVTSLILSQFVHDTGLIAVSLDRDISLLGSLLKQSYKLK